MLRRNVGVVFQDYKLLPKKTVYENIAYAMQVIGERRRNIKKRVMEVLDLVGLKHKVRSFPNGIVRWGATTDCDCSCDRQQSESLDCG